MCLPVRAKPLAGSTKAGEFQGRGQTKNSTLALQAGGWAWGQQLHSRKKEDDRDDDKGTKRELSPGRERFFNMKTNDV